MSDNCPQYSTARPACQNGKHDLMCYVKGCTAAQRGNMNLMNEGYLVPPSSTTLPALSDSIEKNYERFRREEIESEREFNEGRVAASQLMDASVTDIANAHDRAMPVKDAHAGDAFYDASKRIDDSCAEHSQPGDVTPLLRQMPPDKNELIQSFTSQLHACQDTTSCLNEREETPAARLAMEKEIAALNMETASKTRDEFNECRDIIPTREEDLSNMEHAVSVKNPVIECLKARFAGRAEAYTKLEQGSSAEREFLIKQHEEAMAKMAQEHNDVVSDREGLMRQLADRLVAAEASGKRNVDLLALENCKVRGDVEEKQAVIKQYRSDIDDLREKLEARDDTIIKQHKQIKAHFEEAERRDEQAEELVRKYQDEVEFLQGKIAQRNLKIDSLRTENQHLARALACERDIVEDQTQEIAEIQETSIDIAEELQRVRHQRDHDEKDCIEKREFLQSIIGSKSQELEQALLARERDGRELFKKLDVLQKIVASKDAQLEKIHLDREADENDVVSKLELLQSSFGLKIHELDTIRLEREAETKQALEKLTLVIAAKDESLDRLRRQHESDQTASARTLSLLQQTIRDHTAALSTTRSHLETTTAKNAHLINENAHLLHQLTQLRRAAAAAAASTAQPLDTHPTSTHPRLITALRPDNAPLRSRHHHRFQSQLQSTHRDRAPLIPRTNDPDLDLETDAAGWDRVAREETFEPEQSLDDAVTVEADEGMEEDDGDGDGDGESVGSVEAGEAQDEVLPTYEQATSEGCDDSIVETETVNGSSTVELEGEDGDDEAAVGEEDEDEDEDEDWSDMSSEFSAN